MKGVCLALAVLSVLLVVKAADVCKELEIDPKKIITAPHLPEAFVVDIEAVDRVRSAVSQMTMYYFKEVEVIRLDSKSQNDLNSKFFYFDMDEIVSFDLGKGNGRGKCTVVQGIAKNMNNFMFGGVNPIANKPKIPGPLAALHFMGMSGFGANDIREKWVGVRTVRGKDADMYTSCQKWISLDNNIVLNVTHYFAGKNVKFPMFDKTNSKWDTLLSIEIKGTGKMSRAENTDVDQIYNYFNFRRFEEDSTNFETPEGVVCKGRMKTKTFPKIPNYVKFSYEEIDRIKKITFSNVETCFQPLHELARRVGNKVPKRKTEVYDYDHKYAIFKSMNKLNPKASSNRQTFVYDFSSGLVFIIDEVDLTCQNMKIRDYTDPNFNIITANRLNVTMLDPEKFFMARPEDYTFLGQKTIRGLTTDVWVAPSDLFPGHNVVVQFHFAGKVHSWNDNYQPYLDNQWPIPIKAKVWINDADTVGNTQNVFHVDYNPLRPDYIDLSPCYQYSQQFQVVLKGTKDLIINSYEEGFKFKAKDVLTAKTDLGFNQINRMKLFYTKDNHIIVEFIVGEFTQANLDKVVKQIKDGLKSGDIKFMTRKEKTSNWINPLPFVKVDSLDLASAAKAKAALGNKKAASGYSKGAMAGLGVGMVILGVLGGAGAGFAHGKYFG